MPDSNYKRLTPEEWENAWQRHWKDAQLNYELPKTKRKGSLAEHEFLTERRTADKEIARLERINKEFEMGFKKLGKLGAAVTVFGSARLNRVNPFMNYPGKQEMFFQKPASPFLPVVVQVRWKRPIGVHMKPVAQPMNLILYYHTSKHPTLT